MSRTRCIFMASDPIALPSLECIRARFSAQLQLAAVYTQPDRRSGRGKRVTTNPVKQWAQEQGIEVHQPPKMDGEAIAQFEALKPELVVVMAYGHLLPRRMLALARLGFVNLHASLLPQLRGASPIETAIVTGENRTGVTLMQVVPALDAGPIIDSECCDIAPDATGASLRQHLSLACDPLLRRNLPALLAGNAPSWTQDESKATYCRLLDKSDGWLDFQLCTTELLRHIRGFQTWPGALFTCGGVDYRIGAACGADPSPASAPGTLERGRKHLRIATADGWLDILEIQKPGGTMLPVHAFLNGCALPEHTQLRFPARFPLVKDHSFRKPASSA